MSKKFVCDLKVVSSGEMKGFDIDGKRILILNTDDGIRACDGVCPHQEVLLEEGLFDGQTLTCHSHLWQWDVCNGDPLGIAECQLKMFDVSVDGEDRIFVKMN